MSPFAKALKDYHAGSRNAHFTVCRDDGFAQVVPVSTLFDKDSFSVLERRALDLCRGDVLDVGAGAGRHSLELRHRGFEVWSLDILPEACSIMKERGVPRPIHADILSWGDRSFDTVLLLMNGIGLVGSPDRLNAFLKHARHLVSRNGQILCDSIDVSMTDVPMHVAYRKRNCLHSLYPGQQRLRIDYEEIRGGPFDWLHLDFEALVRHCEETNWNCQLIERQQDGHYLAKISLPQNSVVSPPGADRG